MINLTKYIKSPDVKEFWINKDAISIISVTKCSDSNMSLVKIIVSNTPLELKVNNNELDELLNFLITYRTIANDNYLSDILKATTTISK